MLRGPVRERPLKNPKCSHDGAGLPPTTRHPRVLHGSREKTPPLSTASLLLTAPCATPHAAELTRLRREDAGCEGRETEVSNWAGLLDPW